jgi:aspartate/methionine/tyrosine aminotransferase
LLARHRVTPLKGVVVGSPANPSGTMMTASALTDLVRCAEEAGIIVISDEIYHGLDYAFAAECAARISDDVILINSFSKYFCMTGWRIGWMVVPPSLVRAVERLQQNLAISVPTLSQIAAEAAFEGRAELAHVRRGYEENRWVLLEGLPRVGLESFLPADGAFYLYADVSRFSDDSFAFASRMLEETSVAATPGVDFDPVRGKNFVRFCYAGAREEMSEAVARIGYWLRTQA